MNEEQIKKRRKDMLNKEEKNIWEMSEEEQQKYYNEKSNELIDITITQILRNKIMYNKKLREKIQKEIDKLIRDTINDML